MENSKRVLLKTFLDIPKEPNYCIKFHSLPQSNRDIRHEGDLCWHEYHHMSELSESKLLILAALIPVLDS